MGLAEGLALYAAIIALYLPWPLIAVRYGLILRYPFISFCYLGLLTQNALGSVFVVFPKIASRHDYFSYEYVWMLVVQLLLFVIVTTPYILKRRTAVRPFRAKPKLDAMSIGFLVAAASIILANYVARNGTPPLLMVLSGRLAGLELIKYRVDLTYGLGDYSLYHIGITVLPTIIGVMSFLLGLLTRRKALIGLAVIAVTVTALPAGKGSIIDSVTALIIAYLFYRYGYTTAPRGAIHFGKIAAWLSVAFVPVVLMYGVYYEGLTVGGTLLAIVYRLFGVNSESMAAAIMYTREVGHLAGATLPTIRGLLDHHHVNLAREMHQYMFGPGGGAPISALAEGYINFGWIGFMVTGVAAFSVVTLFESLSHKLPRNLLMLSVLVLYVLFATKISQASLFATFVSLTYAVLVITIIGMRAVLASFMSPRSAPGWPMPSAGPPHRSESPVPVRRPPVY